MNVGDLVSVIDNYHEDAQSCQCAFCWYDSSKIGIIVSIGDKETIDQQLFELAVQFDFGQWQMHKDELKLIQKCTN
jgi:hypothetical protein